MTERLSITPAAQAILDDRATGTHDVNLSQFTSKTSPLSPATKWAARVHGSVYVHPYVYGSARGDAPMTYAGNRDAAAKENGTSIVKVKYDDYADVTYQRFPIAGVSGEYWGNFDTLIYVGGKLYVWGTTKDISTTDLNGHRSALLEVDPDDLSSWTVKYSMADRALGNAAVADSTHYYVSAQRVGTHASSGQYGIIKVNLATGAATVQQYVLTSTQQQTGAIGPAVPPFANGSFHSLVEDGAYLYGLQPPSELNNWPGFAVKIGKADLALAASVQVPQATDDMTHNATHLFGGVEVNFNQASTFGRNYGAFAVRKSDMALLPLPKLGPEDQWTSDPATNVVSYASLIYGDYLVDVKTPINRMYLIDLSDVDSWSLSSDASEVVLADVAINMANVKALRRYHFAGAPAGEYVAVNDCNPNELLVDPFGTLHAFCWAYPFPSTTGVFTTHEGVSSLIRFAVPGYDLSSPPVVDTLEPTSNVVAGTTTLRGDLVSLGGAEVTERGFYHGANPAALTKQAASGVSQGVYGLTLTLSPGAYFVRAYAISAVGESTGEMLEFEALAQANAPVAGMALTDNLTVHVQSTATDEDDDIVSVVYDYGDESGETASTVHTYAAPGTYIVTQTVTDANDLEDTATLIVTVPSPLSGVIAADRPPVPTDNAPVGTFWVMVT